jgi:dipeptidyl-peptidase 4
MRAVCARRVIPFTIVLAAMGGPRGVGAQQGTAAPAALTIDQIGALLSAEDAHLTGIKWLPGGEAYTALEPGDGTGQSIVRYVAATGARDVLVAGHQLTPPGTSESLDIDDYQFSADGNRVLLFTNTRRVWRDRTRGDYWVFDLNAGTLRKLGGADAAPSTLMFAKFSPDGSRVGYVRDHNIYVEDLAGGTITALTSDGSPTIINGTTDWVYEEEFRLRDGWRWSPDGTRIAYWQLDDSGVRDYDLIDDTDSLYSFIVPVQYPKAGQTNSAARIGIVSATGGTTRWLDVPGDPRQHYIARMQWAPGSRDVILQHLDRVQSTNELMLGDAQTGTVRTVLTDHDSTWVDVDDDPWWVDGGRSFLWVSERDGWRHLYLVSRDGTRQRLLTPGAFDLAEPGSSDGVSFIKAVDTVQRYVYYLASPGNATQLYLYRSRLDGVGRPERVTPPAFHRGVHTYNIAPGAHWALHTFSQIDVPPTVELVRLPTAAPVRTLLDNARLEGQLQTITRGPVEFTTLAGDSTSFDAWYLRPPGFDSTRKYPTLLYIYGGPAEATVFDAWDPFNYLWHLSLAQQGYVILSVDNRGTPAPKGRAWRRALYHKIGVLDSRDQAAALHAWLERPGADATRVGVWGWSNGGSMALNLLFRYPDLYQAGMAVAPVTDQRFYDTIYTERYMGLPGDDSVAYREASPITYAANLRGKLLIVHGSGDDNVHFQNTEALINALVAADRPFSLMDYPNRTHCICEGRGTSRHLLELLNRYLVDNLPAGPR